MDRARVHRRRRHGGNGNGWNLGIGRRDRIGWKRRHRRQRSDTGGTASGGSPGAVESAPGGRGGSGGGSGGTIVSGTGGAAGSGGGRGAAEQRGLAASPAAAESRRPAGPLEAAERPPAAASPAPAARERPGAPAAVTEAHPAGAVARALPVEATAPSGSWRCSRRRSACAAGKIVLRCASRAAARRLMPSGSERARVEEHLPKARLASGAAIWVTTQSLPFGSGTSGGPCVESKPPDVSGDIRWAETVKPGSPTARSAT